MTSAVECSAARWDAGRATGLARGWPPAAGLAADVVAMEQAAGSGVVLIKCE